MVLGDCVIYKLLHPNELYFSCGANDACELHSASYLSKSFKLTLVLGTVSHWGRLPLGVSEATKYNMSVERDHYSFQISDDFF